MQNAVIFSNNIYLIKNILDSLNTQFSFSVITNLEDLSTLNSKIDIIFLDSQLDLKTQNVMLSKYKDTIVFVQKEDFKNTKENPLLLNKFQNFSSFRKRNLIRHEVIQKLKYLGYNFKHKGSNYIVDAILESINIEDDSKNNLEKNIYPIIAKKYKKTVSNIKGNIYTATEHMYYESDANTLKNFFHSSYDIKPSPKEVIFTIINSL